MAYFVFLWTAKTEAHLAEHGVTCDEFEQVVCFPESRGVSRSSGLPAAWGFTADGRYLMVVYEQIDELTVQPVTAYEVPEPR